MSGDVVYLLTGAALLVAVVLPNALSKAAISTPMVLLLVGMVIGLLPVPKAVDLSPLANRRFIEHLTEFAVLIALMGAGLALDRPLEWRSFATWRKWGATWRLLAVAMPLCIAAVALLGWWAMGLGPAAAVLLGAVLAPTDPVLASDVGVEGPTTTGRSGEEIDEPDEVRFALTSEAGLNDGLAFPFVNLAILLATRNHVADWALRWIGWELVGKTAIGTLLGVAMGWVLARAAFSTQRPSLGLARSREPLLALTAVLLSYGLAEVAGGYGFLAVFACAMTLRSAERGHEYHALLHQFIEQLERLLTVSILLILGVALTKGLLRPIEWPGPAVGALLILVIRPLTGVLALSLGRSRRKDQVGEQALQRRERIVTALFGIRGVGSLYYLAYATGVADFGHAHLLWSTVAFTITLSVLLHGIAAKPVMRRLEEMRRR